MPSLKIDSIRPRITPSKKITRREFQEACDSRSARKLFVTEKIIEHRDFNVSGVFEFACNAFADDIIDFSLQLNLTLSSIDDDLMRNKRISCVVHIRR